MAVELDVPQPVLLAPGEGEVITERPERAVRLLLAHELLDVTWSRYEPGERGPDPHVHRQHTDAFYVLEGELVFELGPDSQRAPAPSGTFVAVPPNVIHSFGNEGLERACFLNFHAPSGGFADALRGLADGFDSFDPPADGGGPTGTAIVALHGHGERLERETQTLIKAQLPHLAAIESTSEPGWEGVDPHTHADHVDSFYVLEGNAQFVGGSGHVSGPGTFVAAPPGAVHGFRLSGDTRLVLLNVHAPDTGFTDRLRRRYSRAMDPRERYDEIADDLLAQNDDVSLGQMMGMPCIKKGAKMIGGFTRGAMVFKLAGEDAREQALALQGSHLFDPSGEGKPFREWVVVPAAHAERWPELAELALTSAA